jgi:hypothetical protein
MTKKKVHYFWGFKSSIKKMNTPSTKKKKHALLWGFQCKITKLFMKSSIFLTRHATQPCHVFFLHILVFYSYFVVGTQISVNE